MSKVRKVHLPSAVHEERETHWKYLQELESKRGDAVRITKETLEILDSHKAEVERKFKVPASVLHDRAKQIFHLAAQMADEKIALDKELGVAHKNEQNAWSEAYGSFIKHHWASIPVELRAEMLKQIRGKKTT